MAGPEPVEIVPAPESFPDAPSERADPFTAMTPRFGRLARAFAGRYFGGFAFEKGDAERLQELERDGAVIYVMRYSSRLDYFLFNWLFLASGVRLSRFANGIRFYYYRPLGEAVRLLVRGTRMRFRRGFQGMRERGFAHTRDIVKDGGSAFLFLRTDKVRQRMSTRSRAVESARRETDYLHEVVGAAFDDPSVRVSLVPLALFWRKGSGRRFLNVFYGAPQRPSDTGKVLSFLWNYESLAVRVGEPIDLARFVAERREAGPDRITKQVRRSLLIFLRREEKPVLGAALRPLSRIEEAVLVDPEVKAAMEEVDAARRRFSPKAESRARRYLAEIAANPSPTVLAILDRVVTWMFRRLFARFEVNGLERVVDAAKRSPLVMVPSHRSHFDYVILSWLFYESHLVPPVVAAGINLSFWPLGPIFRRAGAFFLRRTFDGNRLYAAVFRSYVQALIKDGVTQEFFIEGTRSRTGRTLQPRLGMLGMVLDAYGRGVRRDVQIVPVGFTYERLVEESSMTEERRGAAKTSENLLQLLRAGRVLQRSFGAVTVRFGEPISLAELADVEAYRDPVRRRELTEVLGIELCRRINGLITAGRSSVSAAALLGAPNRALRSEEFRTRVVQVAELLGVLNVARSENLQRCLAEGRPEAAAELLLQSNLVTRREGTQGVLLEFPEAARERLAYYRATIQPALAWPAVLALALRRAPEAGPEGLLAAAAGWLDLLRLELFPAAGPERARLFARVLAHFEQRGWVHSEPSGPVAIQGGDAVLAFLGTQVRPLLETYQALFTALSAAELPVPREALMKRAREVLEEQLALGEARCPEAVCDTTLGNALLFLADEGVIEVEGNPRSAKSQIRPGERWDQLDALVARAAAGLPSVERG